MQEKLESIRQEIINHKANQDFKDKGWQPIYTAGPQARLAIIGQAPGIKAQESQIPWHDASGERLREWLGIEEDVFYDPNQVALIPMDFYYPGKAKTGDKPPRKEFYETWHPRLFDAMPDIQLTLLVGQYAQKAYLKKKRGKNLTETVRHYQDYLPSYFPLVHPSPLNGRWLKKNPWFIEEVVPDLQAKVHQTLNHPSLDESQGS